MNEPCTKFSSFERKKSRGLKNVSDLRGKDYFVSNLICIPQSCGFIVLVNSKLGKPSG